MGNKCNRVPTCQADPSVPSCSGLLFEAPPRNTHLGTQNQIISRRDLSALPLLAPVDEELLESGVGRLVAVNMMLISSSEISRRRS